MTSGGPGGDGPDETAAAAVRPVLAAGGIVLDGSGPDVRVLVVHRPSYDDWSLPKGHVDSGEELADTALREVAEETGVHATIVADAGTTEHAVRVADRDAVKRVTWFTMRPAPGHADPSDRSPDDEVDRATWWTVDAALTGLTHAGERELLQRVVRSA